MAKEFPLYDELYNSIKGDRMQSVDLWKICSTISNLDKKLSKKEVAEHNETIMALMLHHELVETNGMSFKELPYNARVTIEGYRCTTTNLPPILQQIIAVYVLKYVCKSVQ